MTDTRHDRPKGERGLEARRHDARLFAAHDAVNVLVFVVVLGLPHVGSSLLVHDYATGKILHLLGLGWFFGGLILATAVVSRFVWMQPSLDHEKLAYGFRFILALELLCIPSIALMAYGGASMVAQLGGLDAQPWAYQGWLFLVASPPILMMTPRFVHKRLIKDPTVDIDRERRRAFWMDWSFIAFMALLFGGLTVSMVQKAALF